MATVVLTTAAGTEPARSGVIMSWSHGGCGMPTLDGGTVGDVTASGCSGAHGSRIAPMASVDAVVWWLQTEHKFESQSNTYQGSN